MPTKHKNFFNQLDNHLKTLKTNHRIKLLKADPHIKFLFLHYQPLTYPFQSQCTITSQAGIFLKICHNRQFRDGVEALCLYSHSPNNCKTVYHGHNGALLAPCECTNLPELLDWFRTFYAYQYTLGTITSMTFNKASLLSYQIIQYSLT